MAEEPPRGSCAIKYVCMYVCKFEEFLYAMLHHTLAQWAQTDWPAIQKPPASGLLLLQEHKMLGT